MSNVDRRQIYIETDSALQALAETLAVEPLFAADTESNSFHAYTERVCLVQLSTPSADYVIDPLATDLRILAPRFSDPGRMAVFHAAEGDVVGLRRDFDFSFGRIFDTMAAAKILGRTGVGLQTLAKELLGIELSKDEQRSDWGRRPLSASQLTYAFSDARHLLALRDVLHAELVAKNRLVEAEAEFARLTTKSARPREVDPQAWTRIAQAKALTTRERAVLKALVAAREVIARKIDRPLFKVVSDESLLELARARPQTQTALESVRRFPPALARRFATELLAAVAAGEAAPEEAWPTPLPPPPQEVLERFEKLRAWRKKVAAERAVEVQVILPNATLMAVARVFPTSAEQLQSVDGMDRYRVETYATAILAALSATS